MTAPRIIDFKLPLSAVISGAVTVAAFMLWTGYQAAIQTSKMESLIVSTAKLEKRLDDRDARVDALRDTVNDLRRATDMNTIRVTNLENRK